MKITRETFTRLFNNNINLNYGDIVKGYIFNRDVTDTVLLINDLNAGNGFSCLLMDLSTKEILDSCKDIEDFKKTYKIEKVVGNIEELLNI